MKSFGTEVVESVRLFSSTHALWFQRPDHFASAVPGQFVMAYAGESDDPFLGAAISILGTRDGEAGAEFGILVTATDRVTDWLTRRRPGDHVRLVGALGHGFQPRERVQRMLLVGEGNDIGALVWLASSLAAEEREVTLLLSGSSASEIYPASLLPSEIELVVATEDGSLGTTGGVIDSFPTLLTWCDQAFISASAATQQDIYRAVRDSGTNKPVQVLLHAPMACGTGICDGCAVFPQRGGVRLVCADGPVFDLRDLYA